MKKVLILALNSKYVHTLLSPYYLKNNADYENIEIIQSNINVDIDQLFLTVCNSGAEILALPTYIFNVNKVVELVNKIKNEGKEILIIAGGPEVSFEYESYQRLFDYIICGEGEGAFKNLLRQLNQNEMPKEKIIEGVPLSGDMLKSPYSADYFSDTKGKIAYFEASRGCPFRCSYCMSARQKLRLFELEHIFSELDKFKGADIRVLKFVDRTFNCNKDYANAILDYVITNAESFPFTFHFEVAPELIDDNMLSILSKAPVGYIQFEVGAQSFNRETLKAINRTDDIDTVLSNIKKLVGLKNCHIHTDLIAGLPYENFESFKKSFNLLFSLKSHQLQLGFLKILKGSELKKTLLDGYFYSVLPPYEITSTPFLSQQDIKALKLCENALEKLYNSARFAYTLDYFMPLFESPFDFFTQMGIKLGEGSISLFELYEKLLQFLMDKGFEKLIVESFLKMDYITTNSSSILPKCLSLNYSPKVKKIKRELVQKGQNQGCFSLEMDIFTFEQGEKIVLVDYLNKNPATNMYSWIFI